MPREIENIFADLPGNNCFACHPDNKTGLKLKFYADDETGEVFTIVRPERHFNGFPGVVHGGIQCAILDELAFWAMFDKLGKLGVTKRIDLRYLSPVGFDLPIEARAKVLESESKNVRVSAVIKHKNGGNSAKAIVTYGLADRGTLCPILGEEFVESLAKKMAAEKKNCI